MAKSMDKAPPAAFKEMKHVRQFIAGTKDYGLKIAPSNQHIRTSYSGI
jgi:hypothetical protein